MQSCMVDQFDTLPQKLFKITMSFSIERNQSRPWPVYCQTSLKNLYATLSSLRSSSFQFMEYDSDPIIAITQSFQNRTIVLISAAKNVKGSILTEQIDGRAQTILLEKIYSNLDKQTFEFHSQMEILEWLVRNREAKNITVRVSCILDKTIIERCKKVAEKGEKIYVDYFWSSDQLTNADSPEGGVVLVLPYEMVSPLPKYFRVLIMRQLQNLEIDLLKAILSDLRSEPYLPASPPRLPTPTLSLQPYDPAPKPHTIFDMDPHTCLKLQAYCSECSIEFIRLEDVDLKTVITGNGSGQLLIVSREGFQKIRNLGEVPQLRLVLSCRDLHNLAKEELDFAKEFKQKLLVMVSSKDSLVNYLEELTKESLPQETKPIKPNTNDRTTDDTQAFAANSELSKRYPPAYEVPKKSELSNSKSLLDIDMTSPAIISTSLGLIAEEDATSPLSQFLSSPVLPRVESMEVVNESYGFGLARYVKQSNQQKAIKPLLKETQPQPSPAENPYELQTPSAKIELTAQERKNFIQSMFDRKLVYILVDERYSGLLQKIEGVRFFNVRLRIEPYNPATVVSQVGELLPENTCVVVATELVVVDVLVPTVSRDQGVFVLYCGKQAKSVRDRRLRNTFSTSTVKSLVELIGSIPRFFRQNSQQNFSEYSLIHIYFQDILPDRYKIKVLELAELEKRKVVPHELGSHYEVLCSAEKLKNQLFVCVVVSAALYQRIQSKGLPNVKVFILSVHKKELEELFRQLNILSKWNNPQPLQADLQRRLINVQFKKFFQNDSSGISQSSGKIFSSIQSEGSIINNISSITKPLLAKLQTMADPNGVIHILIPNQNNELRQMLRGLPGLNVIEYTSLHSLQMVLETPVTSNNKRLIVCNEIVQRYITSLRNMYPYTQYITVNSRQSDALNIQSNIRLAVLLCTRAELTDNMGGTPKSPELPSHVTLILPCDSELFDLWRQRFPQCAIVIYSSIAELFGLFPSSGLALVLQKNKSIVKVQRTLAAFPEARFIRILSDQFNDFSSLTENDKVLAEVGSEVQALECAIRLVIYGRKLGLISPGPPTDLRKKRAVFARSKNSKGSSSASLLRSASYRFMKM